MSKIANDELAKCVVKNVELELSAQLQRDDSVMVASLQAVLFALNDDVTVVCLAAACPTNVFKTTNGSWSVLQLQLDSLHCAGLHCKGVMRDFIGGVCTAYSNLIRTQVASY